MTSKLASVCVAYPSELPYSETFIRAHIERMPCCTVPLRVDSIYKNWVNTPALPYANAHWRIKTWLPRLTRVFPSFRSHVVSEFLRRNNVDVVLSEFATTATHLYEACLTTGIPLVTHFHGFDAFKKQYVEENQSEYKRVIEASSAIIAVSREMRERLLSIGVPPNKLFTNPCGVDTDIFAGGRPADQPPTFLSVGRFVDKKGPLLSLMAFEKVARVIPEARLVMVGDGPLLESCKQFVRSLKLHEQVEFAGVREHHEVSELMRNSRALVQHSIRTSYGDREGTPVCVLEAGSTGLPVIATRHGGIAEAVIDAETGYLCDEGDIDTMVARMIRIAEQPFLASALGRAAREHIIGNYSMVDSVARLCAICEFARGNYGEQGSRQERYDALENRINQVWKHAPINQSTPGKVPQPVGN